MLVIQGNNLLVLAIPSVEGPEETQVLLEQQAPVEQVGRVEEGAMLVMHQQPARVVQVELVVVMEGQGVLQLA
jgi:hypothetical protein